MPDHSVLIRSNPNHVLGGSTVILLFLWGWLILEKGLWSPEDG